MGKHFDGKPNIALVQNRINKPKTYRTTPRLKTWRELGVVEVAPMNAEPELAGETRTLCGTPVKTTLPLTMRQPSLMLGVAVIVISIGQ